MEKFGQAHPFNLYLMPFIEEQHALDAPTSLVSHLCLFSPFKNTAQQGPC